MCIPWHVIWWMVHMTCDETFAASWRSHRPPTLLSVTSQTCQLDWEMLSFSVFVICSWYVCKYIWKCISVFSQNDHRIKTVVFGIKWSRRYWYVLWNKVGVSCKPHYVFNFWRNIENTKIYWKIEVICKSRFFYFSFWWSRALKRKRSESLIIGHWDKSINQRLSTDFLKTL